MATQVQIGSAALVDRLHAADRYSPDGLLLRDARVRTQGFRIRQTVTLIGAASIALLASPALGLLTAVLALLGESLDCLTLLSVARRLEAGAPIWWRLRHRHPGGPARRNL